MTKSPVSQTYGVCVNSRHFSAKKSEARSLARLGAGLSLKEELCISSPEGEEEGEEEDPVFGWAFFLFWLAFWLTKLGLPPFAPISLRIALSSSSRTIRRHKIAPESSSRLDTPEIEIRFKIRFILSEETPRIRASCFDCMASPDGKSSTPRRGDSCIRQSISNHAPRSFSESD